MPDFVETPNFCKCEQTLLGSEKHLYANVKELKYIFPPILNFSITMFH